MRSGRRALRTIEAPTPTLAPTAHVAIALMLLSPLAVLPSGLNPFTFPKLTVAALACCLAFASPRRGRLPRSVLLVTGLGGAAFVISSLMTTGLQVAISGRLPRYEGLLTLGTYLACAVAGARLFGRPSSGTIRQLHLWAAVSACVLFAFSVLDTLRISPIGFTEAVRTGSLLGNATDQGLVAMMLASLLARAAFRRRSVFLSLGLVAALLTIGLSGSRAAILGVLLVMTLHLISLDRRRMPGVLLAIGLVLVATIALPQSRDRLLVSSTFHSRVLAWQESATMSKSTWLSGVGPSGYSDAIGAYQDPEWVKVSGSEAKPDSPHSWVVQALTTGGVPLLLAALALAVVLVRSGYRSIFRRLPPARDADPAEWSIFRERRDIAVGLYAAMIGYGAALLINFTTPATTCLAAFITGAAVALHEPRAERTTAKVTSTVIAAALVVVMGSSAIAEVTLQSGAQLASVGRLGAAKERFDTAHHLRPLDPDVHMVAAQYFAQRASVGDTRAAALAVDEARRSLSVTPDAYESAVALGVGLVNRGQLVPALGVLNGAVADYPFRGQAYTQRALVLIGLGRPQAAITDLQRAIVLRPKDPIPVRILLGLAARTKASKPAPTRR